MKTTRILILLLLPLYSFGQYHGGSDDGVSQTLVLNQNPLTSIYLGGINDGVTQTVVLNQNPFNSIYTGGNDDGTAGTLVLNQNPLNSIYIGGIDDGTAVLLALNQNPNTNIYLGGIDDGTAVQQALNQNPLNSIYIGGINDGVAQVLVLNQNPLSSIYVGGVNDGVAMVLALNQNPNVVLPVELLAFSGQWRNEDALLQWETASEVNLEHFELERSDDGGLNFNYVATIAPGGNAKNNYSYTDVDAYKLPPTMLFYRLKCVGKDGGHKYSAVARLNKDKALPTIVAYPNPTTGRFTLALSNTADIDGYSYQITTNDGRMLQRGNITSAFTDFDLSQQAAATYHVFIVKDGKPIQQITIVLTP